MEEFLDPREHWDEVVEKAPSAWFWSTRAMHDFRVCCLESAGALLGDASFLLVRDGKPVGLAPLVFCRDGTSASASYGDTPLPWPAAVEAKDEPLLFDEIERRIAAAGVDRARFMLAPASGDLSGLFAQTVRQRSMIDVSFQSHDIAVDQNTLPNVRERYRRYIRKFRDDYTLSVLSGNEVPDEFAATYMELHSRDAGRIVRPLSTFERQIDMVRMGEAFCVTAFHKGASKIVGALIIALYKNAAYDASVAVDPDYADEPVSNLLKWRTVERLLEVGARTYELGQASSTPTYVFQPSAKNYGISFFKEGWTRGRTKAVLSAEKFYSRDAFDRFWEIKRRTVSAVFFKKADDVERTAGKATEVQT
jgi:hypothetical protein